MVSAKDFIAYVYVPLQEAWGYIYGTAGRMWTEALQQAWSQPPHKNYEQTAHYGAQWIGRMVTDCSGLLCWALKQLGIKDFVHQARYQYTDQSKAKGKLINGQREDGQPILPGTAVFLKGSQDHIHHVGIYVGHGICIEAKGTRWGVVTSQLSHWDHWGELKVIDYSNAEELENEPVPDIPELKPDYIFKATVDNPGKWLNVRQGPGTSYPVLYRLTKGDIVDVLAISDDQKWDQVRNSGRVGWASAEYLTIIDDAVDDSDDAQDIPDGDKDDDDLDGYRYELMASIKIIRDQLDMMMENIKSMGGD